MPAVDDSIGLVARTEGWVASPSYLLRRARILHHLACLPPAMDVLEIGCGAGALLADFRRMGHRCAALESSPQAYALASRLHADDADVGVHCEPLADWEQRFDLVAAFEVLEHIEDDRGALAQWTTWVKPDGYIMLSVPAGPHRWDASDVWAGHFRRYTRDSLGELVSACGFEIRSLETYGFPLANMTAPLRAFAKSRSAGDQTQPERTAASGIDRTTEGRLFPLMNSRVGRATLSLFYWLQGRFASRDWGPGYLVVAKRR